MFQLHFVTSVEEEVYRKLFPDLDGEALCCKRVCDGASVLLFSPSSWVWWCVLETAAVSYRRKLLQGIGKRLYYRAVGVLYNNASAQ